MEKIYDTCLELCDQRHYKIVEKNDHQILALKKNGKQMCVFLANSHKFNIERLQEYISIMKKMDVWHCIIVYKDSATSVAKNFISGSDEMIIELFNEDELKFNLTKHILVPLHELVVFENNEECENFKKKYEKKLPIIKKTDPVARFYGFKKGDFIKVTRKDGFVCYRIIT